MRPKRELPNHSFVQGRLPISCVMCQQGAKLVLLVTGKCSHDCYYCPLSLEKKGRDVIFANELRVQSEKDIIFEAQAIGARGTGITGGDPLLVMERTLGYIRLLKRNFGKGHNIHLYTATADTGKVRKLAEAGLDEIRFHPAPGSWPRLESSDYPAAIREARKQGMRVGMEIPSIPGKEDEIISLALAAKFAGAQFINLNELEFAEGNWQALRTRGFDVRSETSSAMRGSQEAAARVAEALEGKLTVHYCSSAFKDATQLRNRILRRARNTATGLEIITDDGTFIKGIIETPDPVRTASQIRRRFGIPKDLIRPDRERSRVEIAAWVLEEIAPDIGGQCFVVEEYPTADRLEIERRPVAI